MAFPTVPTVADGRIVGLNQLNITATLTGPDLSTLTKSPGDLLIAIAGEYQSSAGADAAFTGWAGGGLTWVEVRDSAGTTNTRMAVAVARVVTGSETGTVTVTRSGTLVGDASMIVMVVPGAHDTTNPEVTVMATGNPADPTALLPSWGAEDTLWIGVNGNGMTATGGTWTANSGAPTNYTDFFGTNPADTSTIGDFGLAVAFRQLNTSSEDMGAFSQDTSNARSGALVIAVRPAPAPTLGPVREFDGLDDEVITATGTLSGMTYGTVAFLVKRMAQDGYEAVFAPHDSSNTFRGEVGINSGTQWFWYTDTVDTFGTVVTGEWYCVVVRKATGTATPRFSVYRYSTSTWSHGDAIVTQGDWLSPGAGGSIRMSSSGTDDFPNIRLAARAAWTNALPWSPDSTGDAAIEGLGLETTAQAWIDANPDAFWLFNQAVETDPVLDLTGNGADETSITGTSVITSDAPSGFDFNFTPPSGGPISYDVESSGIALPGTPVIFTIQAPQTNDVDSSGVALSSTPVSLAIQLASDTESIVLLVGSTPTTVGIQKAADVESSGVTAGSSPVTSVIQRAHDVESSGITSASTPSVFSAQHAFDTESPAVLLGSTPIDFEIFTPPVGDVHNTDSPSVNVDSQPITFIQTKIHPVDSAVGEVDSTPVSAQIAKASDVEAITVTSQGGPVNLTIARSSDVDGMAAFVAGSPTLVELNKAYQVDGAAIGLASGPVRFTVAKQFTVLGQGAEIPSGKVTAVIDGTTEPVEVKGIAVLVPGSPVRFTMTAGPAPIAEVITPPVVIEVAPQFLAVNFQVEAPVSTDTENKTAVVEITNEPVMIRR